MTQPNITVSSLDLQRLEALLATQPADEGTAALQDELDRADIVAPQQLPPDVVSMNSVVTFSVMEEGAVERSGETFTRKLVYPRDAGEADAVSVLAPAGSAVLGLAVGDVITWPLPGAKTRRVRIVDVAYQPERSGDYTR